MKALNEEFLAGNQCFGCGLSNPEGLQIRILRDGERTDRLVGTFSPRVTMGGFPQIVHGGLQYTALDCMAGWCTFILRAQGQKVVPLTKGATLRYLRPVRLGAPLSLVARIVGEGPPLSITSAIVDEAGVTCTEADFEYVMLPQEKFMRAVGLDRMPDTYRRHFGEL
ncbi:MAG: PaaI family thioesterase [Myxococcaceae bacterium]|nr:PaaI family thioesterase [Myxococcaceae bacterium]